MLQLIKLLGKLCSLKLIKMLEFIDIYTNVTSLDVLGSFWLGNRDKDSYKNVRRFFIILFIIVTIQTEPVHGINSIVWISCCVVLNRLHLAYAQCICQIIEWLGARICWVLSKVSEFFCMQSSFFFFFFFGGGGGGGVGEGSVKIVCSVHFCQAVALKIHINNIDH